MSYTVVGGETLKTIARNVLGDSSLWWRIAEANGLTVSSDGELQAGQTLSILKLALNANSTGNYQLNDPSGITLVLHHHPINRATPPETPHSHTPPTPDPHHPAAAPRRCASGFP